MDYVTDTHSLVWYFTEDTRLSNKALAAFESSTVDGTIFVPAVVLAEIMFISKKGRISLSFEDTIKKIEESENFQIAQLTVDILSIADKIEVELEMHDKLIVATAKFYEATLISKDENIIESGVVSTVW
ncbi:MAG: PIN domain-containing protein [Nitrospirae bacterium]|nr:MAG: PIN domain-containing protein [Nitrospirota bacterium]